MIDGAAAVELRETVFQLQEDFEAFRKSLTERLNYLERHLPAASAAEYRAILMRQQIEDFRHGR